MCDRTWAYEHTDTEPDADEDTHANANDYPEFDAKPVTDSPAGM
jgi:hypothetical protein